MGQKQQKHPPPRLHSASSCLVALPLVTEEPAAPVGVVFLIDVRRMWEVLCR